MPIYPEIYGGPARNYPKTSSGAPVTSAKFYVTVHNTSNDASAVDEASYAKRRTDGVSSHYYGDNAWVIQSLDTDWRANHVGSTQGNTKGISWEITGVNGWSRAQWMANVAWDKVSAQMARDCQHWGIEPRLLTVAEMQAGSAKGFITHDLARIAWGRTDHTDPGPNFPMDHLIALVRKHMGVDGDDVNLDTPVKCADGYTRTMGQIIVDLFDHTFVGTWTEEFPESLQAHVTALSIPAPAPVDPAAIKAALLDPEVLAAIASAVADEQHKRSAD